MLQYQWGDIAVDFLISFVLIAVMLLLLGFGFGDILLLVMAVIGLGVFLIGGFFAACLIFLISCERKSGEFLEIDDEGRFPRAVYDIDGERVPNLFPCEMIMRDKLYIPEKRVKLLLGKVKRFAVDGNALVTIIVGSAIFIPSAVFVVFQLVKIISEMLK